VGGSPRVSYNMQKLMDHMVYNFRIQLMKVLPRAGGVLGSDIGCESRKIRARIVGSVAHQITLGRYRIGILMPRVQRGGFVLDRD